MLVGIAKVTAPDHQRVVEQRTGALPALLTRFFFDELEDFAAWLLTDFQKSGKTVMVAPAPGFYATPGLGADEVRIAYVLKEADLRASVDILAAALPAYRASRGMAAVPAGFEGVRQPDFSVPAES